MAIVPTVSMLEATMGIPFQLPLLFRNEYWRSSTTLARLGASDRLGRMSTSSKSSLGSLSIRKFDELRGGQAVDPRPSDFLAELVTQRRQADCPVDLGMSQTFIGSFHAKNPKT
jgi:hypothetical protein